MVCAEGRNFQLLPSYLLKNGPISDRLCHKEMRHFKVKFMRIKNLFLFANKEGAIPSLPNPMAWALDILVQKQESSHQARKKQFLSF